MAIHIHLHPRQVDKTKDAGFGKQVEYDPRAVSRLKSDIAAEKLLLSKKKMGQQERSDRQKHIAELEQELSRFRDATKDASFQKGDKVRENRAGAPTWEVLKQVDNILYTTGGNLHVSKAVKVNDNTVTPSQIQAYLNARKEVGQIAAVIKKKEDQGVSISPLLSSQLEQARKKENSFSTEIKQAART